MKSILLTGGAGFVGSALARHLLVTEGFERLVVLDSLTATGGRWRLAEIEGDPRFTFVEGDIADRPLVAHLLTTHGITGVMNLAAAPQPGISSTSPEDFVGTNVTGTSNLVEVCRITGTPLLHCSTATVYGSIDPPGKALEEAPYNPSSPYVASKAAAELMCLAAHKSYRQDIVITRCTQNFGPRQDAGKFIPSVVRHAINDEAIPLYGQGMQIRDWIHVNDHCRGMMAAFVRGAAGQVFNLGGYCERTNLGVARSILQVLGKPTSLLTQVPDQPGHDLRHAVDGTKALRYFGWRPEISFQNALPHLVRELAADFNAAQWQR